MVRILYRLFPFLIITSSAIAVHNFQLGLDQLVPTREEILSEMMYFPSGKSLKIVICGYDMLVSDLVWLKAIQYYGKHALTDMKYQWLVHIFDILTTLDPLFVNGYRLGGLLISEDAGRPDAAIKLLMNGMYQNPERYELPWDIGFINYVVVKDYRRAARYFWLAYLHEGIMGKGIRFAAMACRRAGDYEKAKVMWRKVFTEAPDSSRRQLAQRSINYIQVEEDLKNITSAVGQYEKRIGIFPTTLSALTEKGFLSRIPSEPFGGFYFIHYRKVLSTTEQYDALELVVTFLNQRITAYKSAQGEFPGILRNL